MSYREKVEMEKVESWNTNMKIGDEVEFTNYPGAKPTIHKTKTPASVLGGHTAVVWLEGISGCVSLDHLRK